MEERLGSFLLIYFFESLEKINIKDNLDNELKQIKANINFLSLESLGETIFNRFFYRVSSLSQLIEALEELKKEISREDDLSQGEIIFKSFCREIPRISERFAAVSHFSERSVCLDLLERLGSIPLKRDVSWQEKCEQYHKKNIKKTFDFSPSPPERKLNLLNVLIESNSSSYLLFDQVDFYSVYCFVKRNLGFFNLNQVIGLEEVIAQAYQRCIDLIRAGEVVNDPSNFLKLHCYYTITTYFKEMEPSILNHQKIENLNKDFNDCLEYRLKNIWIVIQKTLSSDLTTEHTVLLEDSKLADEYCKLSLERFSNSQSGVEKILKLSSHCSFLEIWIDECDRFLSEYFHIVDEDDVFIYANIAESINRYLVEHRKKSLPNFSLKLKTTLEQRVQDKLNNKLEYKKSELSNKSINLRRENLQGEGSSLQGIEPRLSEILPRLKLIHAQGSFGMAYLATDINNERVVIKALNELVEPQRINPSISDRINQAILNPLIEEAIKRAVKRDLFEIKIKTAVRPQDIHRALAEEEPQIVYFCGHGAQDGRGTSQMHTDYVKCVLLNACYSSKSAVLIDFGTGRKFNSKVTQTLTVGFTQGYAPPEQLEQKSKWGSYTDVYVLGATLYYLLTKTHPTHAMLRKSDSSSFVEPKKINQTYPELAEAVDWHGLYKNVQIRLRQFHLTESYHPDEIIIEAIWRLDRKQARGEEVPCVEAWLNVTALD